VGLRFPPSSPGRLSQCGRKSLLSKISLIIRKNVFRSGRDKGRRESVLLPRKHISGNIPLTVALILLPATRLVTHHSVDSVRTFFGPPTLCPFRRKSERMEDYGGSLERFASGLRPTLIRLIVAETPAVSPSALGKLTRRASIQCVRFCSYISVRFLVSRIVILDLGI
jgi:hypothetical protein